MKKCEFENLTAHTEDHTIVMKCDGQLPGKRGEEPRVDDRKDFISTCRLQQGEKGDMTPASISEVTAKRTNLLVQVPSTSDHSVPCQPVRERERQREALPAERCPRCHGLVWEVTDSVGVSM